MYDKNFFLYGEIEIEYLKSKDKRLAEVIDTIRHIIGQQISTKAQQTIWKRMQEALASLKGIGVWTAEMIYHHKEIDRSRFERYRKRFSPYCSVASLYLWAVAGGAIPEMKDYAPVKERR